jgi:hypothetical protein
MKRRETKKGIRRTEKRVATYVQDYLKARAQGNEELKYKAGKSSISMLASLLAWYLRLASSWNDKERWIDGLINGHIHLLRSNEIIVHGEMVWGLLRDVGGHQWKEPFSAIVRVANACGEIHSYSLKFGTDAPLSEKLVESGSYYALLPDSEIELSDSGEPICNYSEGKDEYKFYFSKHSKA